MRHSAREFDRPRAARQGSLSSSATSLADDAHPPVYVNSTVSLQTAEAVGAGGEGQESKAAKNYCSRAR